MKSFQRRSVLQLVAVLVVLSALFGIAYVAGQNLDLLTREQSIFDAARQGDAELIERWLRWGTDVNCKDANTGMTPLHMACWNANFGSIEVLLRRGADVNATDIWGRTPLEEAASRGHRNVVDRLQKAGAVVGLRAAVLLRAPDRVEQVVQQHPEEVATLIKPGSDMNTELHFMIQTPEILLFLLDHGLNPNVDTVFRSRSPSSTHDEVHPSSSLLLMVLSTGDAKLLAALLDRGARFHGPRESGTAVVFLREHGNPELLRVLREHDAIPAKDLPPDLQEPGAGA